MAQIIINGTADEIVKILSKFPDYFNVSLKDDNVELLLNTNNYDNTKKGDNVPTYNQSFSNIKYGNGIYVAIANHRIVYSYDAKTWYKSNIYKDLRGYINLHYNKKYQIWSVSGCNVSYYSKDGKTWWREFL